MAVVIGTRGHRHLGRLIDGGRRRPPWPCSSPRPHPGHPRGARRGAALGAINGSLVAFVGIQPIVATLGMLVAGRGIALVIANGKLTEIFDPFLGSLGSGAIRSLPRCRRGAPAFRGGHPLRHRPDAADRGGHRVRRRQDDVRPSRPGDRRQPGRRAPLGRARGTHAHRRVRPLRGPGSHGGHHRRRRAQGGRPVVPGQPHRAVSAITAVVVGGTPFSGGTGAHHGHARGSAVHAAHQATLIRNNLSDSTSRMVAAVIILAAVFIQREREDR